MNYVPVLYNLAILHVEKIDHGITQLTQATHPVAMKDHHVSIGKRSLDLHVRAGVGAAKPGDKLGDTLPAVLDYWSMLCIGFAAVLCEMRSQDQIR